MPLPKREEKIFISLTSRLFAIEWEERRFILQIFAMLEDDRMRIRLLALMG